MATAKNEKSPTRLLFLYLAGIDGLGLAYLSAQTKDPLKPSLGFNYPSEATGGTPKQLRIDEILEKDWTLFADSG
jgi:hypothetical protein